MDEKRRKKRGFFKALCILLLIAAAILAAAMAVASQREGGLRGLWRELRGDVDAEEFFFENASGGSFADLDNGLAVAATSGLYVYDREGGQTFTRLYTWTRPVVKTAGTYGAAYDVGGELVLFFQSGAMIKELKFDTPVISVTVNDLGYLTVCTQEDDYMGSATVYNSLGTAIYKWSAGRDRVLSGAVRSRDELLVLTVGSGGSRVVLLPLNSEELTADYTAEELVIDAIYTSSGVTLVTTTRLIGLGRDLRELWSLDYSGRFLQGYALSSDCVILALSDFQVGGQRTVMTVSGAGEVLGSLQTDGEITDLAVSGGSAAVLSGGVLTVYDRALTSPREYECDFGAERVMIRPDGTVLCAGTFSAFVFGGENELKEKKA